jgi:cell shape-determining protein MreD
MSRLLALFLTVLVLAAAVARINDALTGVHLHFFVGGLFIAYGAFVLPRPAGLLAAILAGAICDARAPVPFGTHVLLFAAGAALLQALRERVPHDHLPGRVGIALAANLALFLALSLLQSLRAPAAARLGPRLVADLICSEIFLALIAPWFFAFQEKALALVPAPREGMF